MFVVYALENGLTVVLAFPLDHALGVPGLALAWAAPYSVAAIAIAIYLRRHVGHLGGIYTGRSFARVGLATAAMAVVVVVVARAFPHGGGDPVLVARLLTEVLAGVAVFAAAARVLGIAEIESVVRPVLRRLRPGAPL